MTRMTRILRFLQFGSSMNDNNTINNITIATNTSNTGNTATASLCAFHSCFRKLLQKQKKHSPNITDPNTPHIGTETKPRFTDQNILGKFFVLFLVFRNQAACLRRKSRSLQPRISNVSGNITTARAHERRLF
jgi:hypothetical protein